jgi:hypothetical protein
MLSALPTPPDIPGHSDTPSPVTAHVPGRQFQTSRGQVSGGLARGVPRQVPYPYSHFFTDKPERRPQNKGERDILHRPLVGTAIVMFGINKVFRANKRSSPLYRPGSYGMDRENLPYRVFLETKDVLPRKSNKI